MTVDAHRKEAGRIAAGFALITVSDTRSAATDLGGRRLRELVLAAGHRVLAATIVRDEIVAIRAAAEQALAATAVDIVLVTGGTGIAPRDRTPEAIAPLFERELVGFGELFRALSFAEIGAAAVLSRATAGVTGRRAIFLLPGSPAALELALTRLILPEVAHLVAQLNRPE